MKKILISALFCFGSLQAHMVNPVKDVCWDCLFPITISGSTVAKEKKDPNGIPHLGVSIPSAAEKIQNEKGNKPNSPFCECPGVPPKVGLPVSYWEPIYLADVVFEPYKFLGMGNIKFKNSPLKKRGTIGGGSAVDSNRSSFYHVHIYSYPVIRILKLFTDFLCGDKGDSVDVLYMSELDPHWNNEKVAQILCPDTALFANPIASANCIADCVNSTFDGKLSDSHYYCAGCDGPLFPFTGTVPAHIGGVQASSLLIQKVLAKLHRVSVLTGHPDGKYCRSEPLTIAYRNIYKTQLAYPIPQRKGKCHKLGSSSIFWGAGKTYPKKGEEFVYILWKRKNCCLDLVKPVTAVVTGGAG